MEALYHATADLGPADIVAPADSQSASGHAISVLKPLLVRRLHVNNAFYGWSVAGRPADCVKLAMLQLLPQRPDLVLSGINAGANTGVNVFYSGTVAAALEGALFGIPSIAFSLELSDELDFHRAGRVARTVLDHILAAGLIPRTTPAATSSGASANAAFADTAPSVVPGPCFNVNIPALTRGWPRGVRVCPQAPVNWEEHYRKEANGDGESLYWLDGRLPDCFHCPDTDMSALRDGYVCVTPLRPNLTDPARLAEIAAWRWPAEFR